MPTAELISEKLTETIAKAALLYTLKRRYQVIADNRNDSSSQALNASGLPQPAGAVTLDIGGVIVYCLSRVPDRPDPKNFGTKWFVDCVFTSDTSLFDRDENGQPVSDPELIVKKVGISFQEYSEPITDAKLISITKKGPEWDDGAENLAEPPWLTKRLTEAGSITNSAGKPIERERSAYRKIITVVTHYNNWLAIWDDFIGAVNSDEVTIVETDSRGIRSTQTFAIGTLICQDITKEDIWKDARLYFRRGVVMAYNRNTWVHAELDMGMERRIFEGQLKPGLEAFTSDEVIAMNVEGDYGLVTIMTGPDSERISLGDPVLFNGSGMEQPVNNFITGSNPDAPVYLNWDIAPKKEFGELDL